MLLRFRDPSGGLRIGIQIATTVYDVTDRVPSVSGWLRVSVGRVQSAIDDLETYAPTARVAYLASAIDAPPLPGLSALAAPVDAQQVWSVSVTAPGLRSAREQTARVGADVYTRAFEAARPALLLRALPAQVVAPYGQVGMRRDSADSVVEPELALLLNPALEMVGYTLCLGVMARDIASENPLYLNQAYDYTHALSLGPAFVLSGSRSHPEAKVQLSVMRDRQFVYEGEFDTAEIKRDLRTMIDYLGRSHAYPDGVVLLTGSGVVVPSDFSLRVGDEVHVRADGIGSLTNAIVLV